jgi:prepilin-type N-terminal cleavage/methylation domain-containing protein
MKGLFATKNMMRFKKSSDSGFTLIELLVVVAIISLLSSVIIASLGDARRKARNSSRLQDVLAYSKAAESYQVNNRKYPDGGLDWTSASNNYVCLGRTSADSTCFGGTYHGSDALNAQFSPEITRLPPGNDANLALYGYGYACLDAACTQYRILYQLEGTNERCAGGFVVNPASGTNTYCEVIQCTGTLKPTRTGGATTPYTCQ